VLALSLWRRLAMLHRLSFDWDEGVYWQSLESMRHGHRLFVEVFSSQPPFFLAALSPIYNLLGGGIVAGRLPVMVGSLVSLIAIFFIGRALAGPWTGLVVMAIMAFDPLYLELSDRLQADLPCVVIGVVGVAVAAQAYRRGSGSALWVMAGGVVGLSIMTKLLGIVFLVPLAWLAFGPDGSQWRRLAAAGSGLGLAIVLVLAPFAGDLSAVYRQAIGLHLGARVSEPQSFGEKVNRIVVSYPAVVPGLAALLATAAAAVLRVRWVGMLLAWLAAALAVDLAQGPLFIHHLLVLVAPLSLLAGAAPDLLLKAAANGRAAATAMGRPTGIAIAAGSVAVVAGLGARAMVSPLPPADASTAPTIAAIAMFVPGGVAVVTDEPFAAAYTGHLVPPNLVDQSHARITSGELTSARVEADTEAAGAQAVIFSTGRLDTLSGFPAWVAHHFRLVDDAGSGLKVWVRDHN
jgi:4-amino-4-deoxy-L-arabinose transferase-like glycosyltransferase